MEGLVKSGGRDQGDEEERTGKMEKFRSRRVRKVIDAVLTCFRSSV